MKPYKSIYKETKNKTLPKSFWDWFKNSKIKDSSGNPLVCYHGSRNPSFNSFNPIKPNFFTYNKKYALMYKQGKGKLFSVYLKIEKPFSTKNEISLNIYNTSFLKYAEKYNNDEIYYELNINEDIPFPAMTLFFAFLRKENRNGNLDYDGVIVDEGFGGMAIVPLYPNQIKSVKNDLTFDISDDNIYS